MLAENLKALRKAKGLSQEELAARLHVTDKAVSKWETGRGLPSVDLLEPLAEALGLTVSELLSGRELTAEDVPHVFDRFFTSDKMRTGRNTGLGLAIVKALADQMGCRLEAALEEDTFCIVLSWPAVREINAAV